MSDLIRTIARAVAMQAWTTRERIAYIGSCLMGFWLVVSLPVFSQEAYYWCYSQEPALSYFDHPPMVAWIIWLGSQLCGNGVLGIRLGTWLLSCGTCWLGLKLLRELFPDASDLSRIAWIVLQLAVPLLAMTRFLANPDAPLLFFWTGCILSLWKAREGHLGWWITAGLAAGCALLSKYTAVFLAVGGILLLILDVRFRHQLRRPGPYLGVILATLVFFPVVAWNCMHELASFRFQTTGRFERARVTLKWLLELLESQTLVLNPILAAGLVITALWLIRRIRSADRSSLWLAAFGLPLPLFMAAQALCMQVKINWLLPAYVTLFLGLVVWWGQLRPERGRPWLRLTLYASLVVGVAVTLAAPSIRLVPVTTGSSWMGWEEVAVKAQHWRSALDNADGVTDNVFYFAPDYKDAAQLTRALRLITGNEHPGKPPASVLAQNTYGRPALQFDYWNKPADHIGENAILVLPRPSMRRNELTKALTCFEAITLVDCVHVERFGIPLLDFRIYECSNYQGPR